MNVQPLCKFSDLVNRDILPEDTFIVSGTDTNECYVYLNTSVANRDRVRTSFSKLTGSKFVNTRCKMLKNA
jgi:hypothetical protein